MLGAGSALEARVISAILQEKNLKPAIKQGLSVDHFTDADMARIYQLIVKCYNSVDAPKSFPSKREIQTKFPGFKPIKQGSDAVDSLVKDLRYARLSTDLNSMAATITEIVAHNEPEEALDYLRSTLGKIKHKLAGNSGMRMSDALTSVTEQYTNALQGGAYGIPWPFPCLTEDTLGKRPGDLIFIYGRAKSMKTWVALKSAMHDYETAKARVFFWSREMQWQQLALRIGSLIGRVDYQLLKRGCLPPPVWKSAEEIFLELRHVFNRSVEEKKRRKDRNEDDLLIFAGREAPRDFEELKACIEENEPEIVYLDSFYHIQNPQRGGRSDHDKLRYLIEDSKQLALDLNIPVVLIHQANRDGENTFGETMTDFARSDAAAAECDLAIKVMRKKVAGIFEEEYEGYWAQEAKQIKHKIKKRGSKLSSKKVQIVKEVPETNSPINYERTAAELALMIPGSRDGTLPGLVIKVNPGYQFDVIEESFTPEDVKRWKKNEEVLAEKERKAEQNQTRESEYKRNPEAAKNLLKNSPRLGR